MTTRAVERGEIAMRNHALASRVHSDQRGLRCDWCFSPPLSGKRLARCGRCHTVHYCSNLCQRTDWAENHRLECGTVTALSEALLEVGVRGDGAIADALLVGRCLRAAMRSPTSGVASLMETLRDRLTEEDEIIYHHLAGALAKVSKLLPEGASAEDAFDTLCRFPNNNFGIVDDLFESLGGGVFPLGAALNHSCLPNCVVTYEFVLGSQPAQVVRVVEDVPQDSELTISYVEMALPVWERRSALASYGFMCCCRRCMGDCAVDATLVADVTGTASLRCVKDCSMPLAAPSEMRDRDLGHASELEESAATTENAKERLRRLQTACELRELWMHRQHLDVMAAHNRAHAAALEAEDFKAAAHHCARLVEQYSAVYPDWHPILGLQMWTLAEYQEEQRPDEARLLYTRAREVLCGTHGAEHVMVHDLGRRLEKLVPSEPRIVQVARVASMTFLDTLD